MSRMSFLHLRLHKRDIETVALVARPTTVSMAFFTKLSLTIDLSLAGSESLELNSASEAIMAGCGV